MNIIYHSIIGNYWVLWDQYNGQPSDYYAYENEVITYIVCSPEANDISGCNYTMGNRGCSSYGDESVLTCIENKWMAIDVWIEREMM